MTFALAESRSTKVVGPKRSYRARGLEHATMSGVSMRRSAVRNRKRLKGEPVDPVRSKIMRAVPRKNSSAETRVRKVARALGLRYRLHDKRLPGSPDLVFPQQRAVVFVHGCFWHRHRGCRRASTPRTRAVFWEEKFRANVARDARVARKLRRDRWSVVVIWECETESPESIELRLRRLLSRSAGKSTG
jgi:DNA mismatch endonuclease Vsr